MHFHVRHFADEARFRLEPVVELAHNYGLRERQPRSVKAVIETYADDNRSSRARRFGAQLFRQAQQVVSSDFPESDWKIFRELRAVALERFCDRVLTDIERVASDRNRAAYDRYIEIYRVIQRRDRELARAFDAPRRSQATMQLAVISSLELVTQEELSRLTPATRDSVIGVAEIFERPHRRGHR